MTWRLEPIQKVRRLCSLGFQIRIFGSTSLVIPTNALDTKISLGFAKHQVLKMQNLVPKLLGVWLCIQARIFLAQHEASSHLTPHDTSLEYQIDHWIVVVRTIDFFTLSAVLPCRNWWVMFPFVDLGWYRTIQK